MTSSTARAVSPVSTAMVCAGMVTAQFIAGKAARDALYLANMEVTSLPWVVIATSAISLALVGLSTRALHRVASGRLVASAFVVSAALFMVERAIAGAAPKLVAPLVYFHVSGLGPMLGSGFWLVATERFDPRSAKLHFGRIAGVGTLGGLAGGLLAERVAAVVGAPAILPVLAVLNVVCAGLVLMMAPGTDTARASSIAEASPEIIADAPQSGMRVLENAPYLRNLAALVLLGTVAAALAEYLLKAQAVAVLGRGDGLLRFFAIYYTTTSLLTVAVQAALSRAALEKLGLAFVVSTPSIALLLGSVVALFAPGLSSVLIARGGESLFRASLFRSGYELFYTPVAFQERRAAKSLIDVGFDRIGDAVGGALVRTVLFLAPVAYQPSLFGLAIACSILAIVVASRLNRGYLQTLERSLLDRAVEVDLSNVRDLNTRTVVLKTRRLQEIAGAARSQTSPSPPTHPPPTSTAQQSDPVLGDIAALRSRDRGRVIGILRRDEPLSMALTPHVIPLLAWDAVADWAVNALRKSCEQHIGLFIDALTDQNQPFAVRRRLARAFSECRSQRAVDGLSLGLDDSRFEVRFQCGRSLAAIQQRNPDLKVHREHLLDVILREVTVGRPVWEMHRLLDRVDEPASSVDEFLKGRASQSLAHVFTLLSLVLPAEPLRVAYRGLQSTDQRLRGTALEYLEGVLPPAIRERLWPFLDSGRPAPRVQRPREKILEDLLHLNATIAINLEELSAQDNARLESDPGEPPPRESGMNKKD